MESKHVTNTKDRFSHDVAPRAVSYCLKHLTYKVDTLINEAERAKIE